MSIKSVFILFLCFMSSAGFAQEKKYYISDPTDLNQTGWNKVLCMKNGNTVLLHIEIGKRIQVIVYDSSRKQIASKDNTCKILDLYRLKDLIFKGLYDINGEAVLFVEQEHSGKNGLVRLRFSSTTGELLDEFLVGESISLMKRTRFYVMKNNGEDSYAILFSTDNPSFLDCNIHVAYYNKNHETTRDVTLEVDRKNYDRLDVVGAESMPNGVFISLGLKKLETNGTRRTNGDDMGTAAIIGHNLALFYIPKDSSRAINKMVDVTTEIYPYLANYTYNSFAKTLNLLLLSYKDMIYKYGLMWQPGALTANLFFKLDEYNLDIAHNWITNKMANNYLKQKTDTANYFAGLPVKLFTNENGLSTLISESYTRYHEPETRVRTDFNTYFGNICITQFDDDGNEIFGIVLPNSQYLKSYRDYYAAYQFSKKWQTQAIFADLPEPAYNRQFVSFNTYSKNRNLYIVYNDYNKNFNNSIEHPGDTVYNFEVTNACYYKMNSKKEITKNYLFGIPATDEYISGFIEGADFDQQRGVYATLVQYRKDNKVKLCMAWSRLD